MKPNVGDQLWYVPPHRNSVARYVEVTRVGRKYFDTTGPTFEIETWREKTDYTDGRLYASPEDHENAVRLQAKWLSLRRAIDRQYSAPNVGEAAIEQAAALLGLDLQ